MEIIIKLQVVLLAGGHYAKSGGDNPKYLVQ